MRTDELLPLDLAPAGGMRDRVLHAGTWALGLRFADRTFAILRTLILARLLAPSDFGLFGIAIVTLGAVEMLSQTGVHAALVQQRGDISRSLNSAWTVQVLRGVFLALILWLASQPIASFFEEPGAGEIIRWMSLSVLAQGLTNIGVVYHQRDLQFDRRFLFQFSGTLVEVIIAVLVGIYSRSVSALVAGVLAGSLTRLAASYIVHPYRPRLRWNVAEFREFGAYGRWVFASGVLVFGVTYGDDLIVGKLLGATALGLYQMAYILASLPATQITHVFSEVAFPVLAQFDQRSEQLRHVYLRSLAGVALLTLPLAAVLGVFGRDLIRVVLGDSWSGAAAPLQVLVVAGALRAFGAANGALFKAVGRPREDSITSLIHFVLLSLLVVPLAKAAGMTGVAVAVAAPMLLSQAYGAYRAMEITRTRLPALGIALGPAAAATAFAVGVPLVMLTSLSIASPHVRVISGVAAYATSGVLGMRWLGVTPAGVRKALRGVPSHA